MHVPRTLDVTPVRRTPDVMPVRRTPDAMPALRPAGTNTDDVAPVQRANWYANHNQGETSFLMQALTLTLTLTQGSSQSI